MMARIGEPPLRRSPRLHWRAAARRRALVPDLPRSRRAASSARVIGGWHWPAQARRRREFLAVPAPTCRRRGHLRIDWRRSARDDHTYVRDREWEAAHTVWLWADPSPSMLYKSARRWRLEGIARAGAARWRWPSCCRAAASASPGRASPTRSPRATAPSGSPRRSPRARATPRPDLSEHPPLLRYRHRQRFPRPGRRDRWTGSDVLARHGVRAHLIEVADPAEETFPMPGAPSSPIPRPARS